MNYSMGIDIGGTKSAYGLFDEKMQLLYKETLPSDEALSGEGFFGRVAEQIGKFADQAEALGGSLAGVGIGVPGFVDFDRGVVGRIPSLPKLEGFAVADFLRGRLGGKFPILVDNDGHCGALAEYKLGAGRGRRNMLYCPVSTGISTGMILDGKLFRGSNGASGESGHMLAAVSGEERIPCMCGNSGCFNSLCSGKAIVSHVRRWLAAGEESILPSLAGGAEKITARHISEACEKGDALAVRAVGQMAHYMAMWIFNVYMLLNVDCIVFSGGLLAMGEKLFGKMREEFESCHTNGFPVEFKFTELGEDSGLIGAACLLSDQVRPTR